MEDKRVLVDRKLFRDAANQIEANEEKYNQRNWATVPSDIEDPVLGMDIGTFRAHCGTTACVAGLGAMLKGYQLLAFNDTEYIDVALEPGQELILNADGTLSHQCTTTVSVFTAGMASYFPDLYWDDGETDNRDWYLIAQKMFAATWAEETLNKEGKVGVAEILRKISRTRSDADAFEIILEHR